MVSHDVRPGMLQHHGQVLILIVMDNGLSHAGRRANFTLRRVLILIVMDNGLSQAEFVLSLSSLLSLNPYCNG